MKFVILAFAESNLAVNVLRHHQGAVDDDSKIDGADREQIGVNALGMQADEGEEKREGNRQRDDDSSAKVDEKEKKNDEHEDHAAQQVVFDRVNGEPDEVASIVERVNFDVWRQDVLVEVIGHCLD